MKSAFLLLFAGGLHALAFAPDPLPTWLLPLLQVGALACLAGAVWRSTSVRHAARLGFAFGLGYFAVGLYWIFISLYVYGQMAAWLAAAAVLALAALLACFPALVAAAFVWLVRAATPSPAGRAAAEDASLPGAQSSVGAVGSRPGAGLLLAFLAWGALWAGAEWLRGTLFTGFPWLSIGYAHVDGPLAGWAPVLGVYGMAFFAAIGAAALAAVFLRRGVCRFVSIATLFVIVVAGAALMLPRWGVEPAGRPLALRLVQGNIPQTNKFDPGLILDALDLHLRLAAQPSRQPGFQADLVVLPETAIPIFQDQLPEPFWRPWVDVAAGLDTTIVTGVPLHTPGADGTSIFTNSVIGFDGTVSTADLINARVPHRYDKAHLVPFGEFVPVGFRWFVDAMVMPLGDFNRGAARQQPFAIGGQHIAFNVCYEDVFGEELLSALHAGPDGAPGATILANVSNLGWFGDSWALAQHLQMARMRSMETGRPSLRATNTGVTAVIDERGRVSARLPEHSVGVLDTTIQGTTGLTPYARWGNAAVLLLIAVVLAAVLLRRRRA